MKYVLSLLVVLLMVSSANATPPWLDKDKFGVGEKKFNHPARMMQMRERMRDRWANQERPNMERPRRGFHGPAFSHRGPGHRGPKGWRKGNKFRSQERRGPREFRGNHKVCPLCKSALK